MRRTTGSNHPVARRVAMASATVLAASGIGLVAAPMAFGQIVVLGGSTQTAGVTNSGSASANSGGNTAIGNNSTNTVTAGGPGLISVPIELGTSANTSDGAAAVATGPATAAGNSAQTQVGQSNGSGNTVNSFLAGQAQSVGVTNAGSASANSGGNAAIGNNSTNTVTGGDTAGGLAAVGVSIGGAGNNSTGRATVTSGAASAVGNSSSTNVGQSSVQGGGGAGSGGSAVRPGVGAVAGIGGAGVGAAPCGSGRFASLQEVDVRNQGQAQANTGNNVAIGNNSTNDFASGGGGTVSGGLLGVGITIGGPVNNSSGTAVINTGPATAVGNNATTQVGQSQTCQQVTTLVAAGRPGVIVPAGRVQARSGTLARTGLDTGDLGMIAGALLGAGMLLIASQRRRMAARSAGVPMAGCGLGLGK